jgi:hypothetical protein
MKTKKEEWINELVEQPSRLQKTGPHKKVLHTNKQDHVTAVPMFWIWLIMASLFLLSILNYYALKTYSAPSTLTPTMPKSDILQLIQQYELSCWNIF